MILNFVQKSTRIWNFIPASTDNEGRNQKMKDYLICRPRKKKRSFNLRLQKKKDYAKVLKNRTYDHFSVWLFFVRKTWRTSSSTTSLSMSHIDTYISPNARFPPLLWSKYSASVSGTTNAWEALHSHLNGIFHHAHPDIFLTVNAFLKI